MMPWLIHNAIAFVATAELLIIVYFTISARSRHSRRRLHRLESARGLMERHIAAMQEVVDHPLAPLSYKEKLLDFSAVIFERDIFLEVLRIACGEGSAVPLRQSHREFLRELSNVDPALATAFDVAVTSAITAMIFRSTKAQSMLDDHLARVALDSQKRVIFMQAAQRGRRINSSDHPTSRPQVAAMAL